MIFKSKCLIPECVTPKQISSNQNEKQVTTLGLQIVIKYLFFQHEFLILYDRCKDMSCSDANDLIHMRDCLKGIELAQKS